MIVQVRLHTALQRVSASGLTGLVALELPPGACVHDALTALALDYDPEVLLLVLNRRTVEPESPLSDGDTLDLIPAISGGWRVLNNQQFLRKTGLLMSFSPEKRSTLHLDNSKLTFLPFF